MSNPVVDLRVGTQSVKRLVKGGNVLWDRTQEVRAFLNRNRTFSMTSELLKPTTLIES